MIYLIKDFQEISDEEYNNILKVLPEERVNKVNKYRFRIDRVLSALSFYTLLAGIWQEYGKLPKEEVWTFNRYGKPGLKGNTNIKFNISHCKNAIAVVVSDREVGIDIQERTSIAKEILQDNNIILLENYGPAERYWSLIEAYGKYQGFGLNYPFREMDFSGICENTWQNFENIKVYSKNFSDCSFSVFAEKKLEIRELNLEKLQALIPEI